MRGIDSNETNSSVDSVDEGPKFAKLVVKTLTALESKKGGSILPFHPSHPGRFPYSRLDYL